MYVAIEDWDEGTGEVIYDWLSLYCERGCMNLAPFEEYEVRYIAEFDV